MIEADGNYILLHCDSKRTRFAPRWKICKILSTLNFFCASIAPLFFDWMLSRNSLPWFHGEYKVILKDKTELRWTRRYIGQRPNFLSFLEFHAQPVRHLLGPVPSRSSCLQSRFKRMNFRMNTSNWISATFISTGFPNCLRTVLTAMSVARLRSSGS